MNVAILANKSRIDLLVLQLVYEHLPKWLQQGVMSWNKGSLELENGSKFLPHLLVQCCAWSYNIIFLDELPRSYQCRRTIFFSVYPTISSGKTTK